MKETVEFINWLGGVTAQSYRVATGQEKFTEFIDELVESLQGVGGFFPNVKREFTEGEAMQLEGLWENQVVKLIDSDMPEEQARTIISTLKVLTYSYMWAVKSKGN